MYQGRIFHILDGDLKCSTNMYENFQICLCLQLEMDLLNLPFSQPVKIDKAIGLTRSKNTNEIVLKVIITTVFDYPFYF